MKFLRNISSSLALTAAITVMASCASSQTPEPTNASEPAAMTPASTKAGPARAESSTTPAATEEAPSPAPEATAAAPTADTESMVTAEGPCEVVCEHPMVRTSEDGTEDLAKANENATEVLEKLQPQMLACYKKRIIAKPQAHAFMMFHIIVGPDGHVKNVTTEGGALLGDQAINCMVGKVKAASFDPPRGGGTVHISVPFTLRRVGPGDTE